MKVCIVLKENLSGCFFINITAALLCMLYFTSEYVQGC